MERGSTRHGSHAALACALALLSGFAALTYQVIWQRILGIFSGQHVYSITLIVTAFMAGLGFGSLVGGRLADRCTRPQALRGFALCEAAIALFGAVSPWVYYDVACLRLGVVVRHELLLPVTHFLLLLPPTLLMGASLPFLCRGVVLRLESAAPTIGLLYGANTLGAAAGAFATIWYAIGAFGLAGTVRGAALVNLAAAAAGFWLQRRTPAGPTEPAQTAPAPAAPGHASFGRGTWTALYALGGFIALSLEIIWFRILDVAIKSSPYVFGHLLGAFLLFLALGGLAGAVLVVRTRRPERVFLWGQWCISTSAVAAVVALARLPVGNGAMARLYGFWSTDAGLPPKAFAEAIKGFGGGPLPPDLRLALDAYVFLPLALMALPTFLMGFTYPYLQYLVQTRWKELGWRVGLVQAANILGAILGSFLTGALFLTALGTPASLRLLGLAGVTFALAASAAGAGRAVGCTLAALLSVSLAWLVPGPQSFWARLHGSDPREVILAEDASSVVGLQRLAGGLCVVRVNGEGQSYVPYGSVWTVLGLVPVLLHPHPIDVLLIGLGSGNTTWAAGAVPSVRRIDVYEIARPEREALEKAQRAWFADPAVGWVLSDRRVQMRFRDGRMALRLEERKYDVVEADALEPQMAHSGNLYSREFFELARGRLKTGGLLCSYAPTDRTRRTFAAVFPYALDIEVPDLATLMIGSNQPLHLDREALRASFQRPAVQAHIRGSSSPQLSLQAMATFFATARITELDPVNRPHYEGDVNTDLFPRDEFEVHQ